MPSYVIFQGDVTDRVRYEEYKKAAGPNINAAGGTFLVRGGAAVALEGDLPATRTVVIEFPNRQAAVDWYNSEEYTAIHRLREGAANASLYVVDGVDLEP
jgi:uncharacterized protein (DUF1330 family)